MHVPDLACDPVDMRRSRNPGRGGRWKQWNSVSGRRLRSLVDVGMARRNGQGFFERAPDRHPICRACPHVPGRAREIPLCASFRINGTFIGLTGGFSAPIVGRMTQRTEENYMSGRRLSSRIAVVIGLAGVLLSGCNMSEPSVVGTLPRVEPDLTDLQRTELPDECLMGS